MRSPRLPEQVDKKDLASSQRKKQRLWPRQTATGPVSVLSGQGRRPRRLCPLAQRCMKKEVWCRCVKEEVWGARDGRQLDSLGHRRR